MNERVDAELAAAPPCPSCGSRRISLWVYGEPLRCIDERAHLKGDLELGGCLAWPGRPEWHCRDCKHDFEAIVLQEYP